MKTDEARLKIIQAANKHKLRLTRFGFHPKLFGTRHLQQAVCVVRRNNLVDAETLITAGFNVKEKK